MKTKRLSGVSAAIRSTIAGSANAPQNLKEFRIKVAQTVDEREAAFRLGYKAYLEKGYVKKCKSEKLICDYDFAPETVILIVTDRLKQIAGTVTLVFSEDTNLPAKKVYRQEFNSIELSGKKVAEYCRFAIDPSYRNSREILSLLFEYASIYIETVKRYDGFIIEVTPRHSIFYKELLGFVLISKPKCCPQVANTVGVLLYLSSESFRQKTISQSGFYKFFNLQNKALIADYLSRQIKFVEKFSSPEVSFSESGFNPVVCV